MDMITAEWLNKYRVTQIIYSDRKGSYVLALALKQDPYTVSKTNIFSDNKTAAKGYIFLGSTNSKGSIYINDTMLNIKNYQNLFSGSNRIYDNGEGSISLYNRTIYSKKVTTKK